MPLSETFAPVIAQQAAGGADVFMLVMFAALALMLFLSFRRAKKAQQQAAEMRSRLTPGLEIMTAAGIFGTVVAVDEPNQRVTLETAPGTRLDVHLQGVANIVEPAEAVVADAPAAADGPAREAGSTAADAPADGVDPRTDRA